MSGPYNFNEHAALESAIAAADAASQVLLSRFRNTSGQALQTWMKDQGALVTDADILSDRAIAQTLRQSGSPYTIISEESRWDGEDTSFSWLVDPLCGTVPFSTGIANWGLNIALRSSDKLVIGALALPTIGELLTSVHTKGVARKGNLFRPTVPAGKLANVAVGLEIDGGKSWTQLTESGLLRWIHKVGQIYSFASAAYPLGQIVLGRLHAAVFYRIANVHIAAGAAIAHEIGLTITDGKGNALPWGDDETVFDIVVAGWPQVHAELLKAINS